VNNKTGTLLSDWLKLLKSLNVFILIKNSGVNRIREKVGNDQKREIIEQIREG